MNAAPRRVAFVSSTGVYAQCNGEWVDETSETKPTDFTGKLMLEGERIFLESGFNASVIRFGGIYGPGRDRTIRSVRDGTARLPAAPSFINLIHREDCAGALEHLLFSDAQLGIYIGVDDEPVDRRILYTWVAEQLGLSAPPVQTEEPGGRAARSNKRCTNAKLKTSGYEFRYPTFRDGLLPILHDTDSLGT
jgi:nucleoside-diphosphate-sugar epimerase